MNLFWARTFVGSPIEFIGDSWEEGGFAVNAEGEPVADSKGNTVAVFNWRKIKPCDAALIATAFAGDDKVNNVVGFIDYMVTELGFCDHQASEVLTRLRLPITSKDVEDLHNMRQARLKSGPAEAIMTAAGVEFKRREQ